MPNPTEALRAIIGDIEDELMPEAGDMISGSLATSINAAKQALREHAPLGVTECVSCGKDLYAKDSAQVCCTGGDNVDGTWEDPVCKDCCGPHVPFNPQREYFPQG